jgi:hypothetical protein
MKFDHEVVLGEDKGKMFSTLIALNWLRNGSTAAAVGKQTWARKIPGRPGLF